MIYSYTMQVLHTSRVSQYGPTQAQNRNNDNRNPIPPNHPMFYDRSATDFDLVPSSFLPSVASAVSTAFLNLAMRSAAVSGFAWDSRSEREDETSYIYALSIEESSGDEDWLHKISIYEMECGMRLGCPHKRQVTLGLGLVLCVHWLLHTSSQRDKRCSSWSVGVRSLNAVTTGGAKSSV